jgi:hypothetical protein
MKLIALTIAVVLVTRTAGEDTAAPRKYADCGAILHADPTAKSGIYSIAIPGRKSVTEVYCDMDTDGGGWTVFQRRKDGTVDFKRTWCEYANGFGNLVGEHWLGNDNIAALTKARSYTLRVDLGQYDGISKFAEYSGFVVSGEEDKYRMKYWSCSYSGNASDAFGGDAHLKTFGHRGGDHNGMKFSTIDQDNDAVSTSSCANYANAGGWFNNCWSFNLNGVYDKSLKITGIVWTDWDHPLKFTEMKIRSVGC